MTSTDLFKNTIVTDYYQLKEPFIIAEAGVNHEGRIELAKRLIDEAKEGGADAIKFQTYRAETLATKNSPAYWDLNKEPTTSQYELFKKHDSFWKKEFVELKKYCDQVKIEFISTPFDVESSLFLNDLMSVFKISSSDLNNLPFIRRIVAFGKPILLSTGASTANELDNSVSWIKSGGNPIALLHCVLNYPTPEKYANLSRIRALKERYPELLIGYSDHVVPGDMTTCLSAVLLGASIIEKHFTFDKKLPGNDHYHAMDMEDLKNLRKRLEVMITSCGDGRIDFNDNEIPARIHARRSLVAAKKIKIGQVINKGDITWKRPATGISPDQIDNIIGKVTNRVINEDEILKLEYFDA